MFLRGWGESQKVDIGRKFAELQQDDFKKHNHSGSETDSAGRHDHNFTYRAIYSRGAQGEGAGRAT